MIAAIIIGALCIGGIAVMFDTDYIDWLIKALEDLFDGDKI